MAELLDTAELAAAALAAAPPGRNLAAEALDGPARATLERAGVVFDATGDVPTVHCQCGALVPLTGGGRFVPSAGCPRCGRGVALRDGGYTAWPGLWVIVAVALLVAILLVVTGHLH